MELTSRNIGKSRRPESIELRTGSVQQAGFLKNIYASTNFVFSKTFATFMGGKRSITRYE